MTITLPTLFEAAKRKEVSPYQYVLHFEDGSMYIGGAKGIYRIRYYRGAARGTYPTFKKNESLMLALKTLECQVEIHYCETLDKARVMEKIRWIEEKEKGNNLLNAREYGVSGKWVERDTEANKRRKDQLVLNGLNCRAHDIKLKNGKSRTAIKGILTRILNKGEKLGSLANLPELEELIAEIKGKDYRA